MISKRGYKDGNSIEPDFSKRYWYGVIAQYYPCGFLDDIDATCDTLEELKVLRRVDNSYEYEVFYDADERKLFELC